MCVKKNLLIILLVIILMYFILNKSNENIRECDRDNDCYVRCSSDGRCVKKEKGERCEGGAECKSGNCSQKKCA